MYVCMCVCCLHLYISAGERIDLWGHAFVPAFWNLEFLFSFELVVFVCGVFAMPRWV